MNILDILIGAPLVWFGYKGFRRGFIAEVIMLAALVLGLYIAFRFSAVLGDKLGIEGEYKALIAFLASFLGILLLMFFISKWAKNLVEVIQMKFLNMVLGFGFGVVKAAVIISIVLLLIHRFPQTAALIGSEKKEQSLFYKPVEKIAPLLFKEAKDRNVQSTLEKTDEELQKRFSSPSEN